MKFLSRLLSFKSMLFCCTLLTLLWLIPEPLFSQAANPTPPPSIPTASSPSRSTPSTTNPNSAANPVNPAITPTPNSTSGTQTTPTRAPNPRSTTSLKRPTPTNQQPPPDPNLSDLTARPSLISQAVVLTFLSLLPFIIMILTSFLKIVVVLSLLRTALGVQQAPPNQIINGVAFLLSLFIMYPTALKMYDAAYTTINQNRVPDSLLAPGSSAYIIEVAAAASEPMRDYLKRNSSARHQALFYRLVYRGIPEEYRADLKPDDFIVLVPSYITGQLKDAFEIGVLIYIPFFVIDLVTSNILLAMGMMMLSPVTISMPLKLFLLVMLDGWTILIEGLVKTFQ